MNNNKNRQMGKLTRNIKLTNKFKMPTVYDHSRK